MDLVDPPKIPSHLQPHYTLDDVVRVTERIGRGTTHTLRDAAMILTLFDTGVNVADGSKYASSSDVDMLRPATL